MTNDPSSKPDEHWVSLDFCDVVCSCDAKTPWKRGVLYNFHEPIFDDHGSECGLWPRDEEPDYLDAGRSCFQESRARVRTHLKTNWVEGEMLADLFEVQLRNIRGALHRWLWTGELTKEQALVRIGIRTLVLACNCDYEELEGDVWRALRELHSLAGKLILADNTPDRAVVTDPVQAGAQLDQLATYVCYHMYDAGRPHNWKAEAIVLAMEYPEMTGEKIAAVVGKHPGTLSRWVPFRLARDAGCSAAFIREGYYKSEGNLEAID